MRRLIFVTTRPNEKQSKCRKISEKGLTGRTKCAAFFDRYFGGRQSRPPAIKKSPCSEK
jgi:hypothetical protein